MASPSGTGALENGNLATIASSLSQRATADGVTDANILEIAIGLYNSSGDVIDRLRDAGSLGDNYTIGMIGAAQFFFNGSSFDRVRTPTRFVPIAAVSISAGTPVAIWTPGTGKKFHLMGWSISLSVAGSVIFKDGNSTEILRTSLMAAGVGQLSPGNLGNGYASSTADNKLYMDTTATGTVTGFCYGTEEF